MYKKYYIKNKKNGISITHTHTVNKGFTLIELLVSITIIGILATGSVATFDGYQERAKIAKNEAECAQVRTCNAVKDVCIEAGNDNCDALCDISGLSCSSVAGAYPDELQWTDASCFIFNAGTISNYSCSEKNIIIPENIGGTPVSTIRVFTFAGRQLDSMLIPDTVTTIEVAAFSGNELNSINIPDSVTTILSSAFFNNNLTTITIPNSVTTLGNSVFNNNNLTSVELSTNMTTIPFGTFSFNQLTSITIPSNIETIESRAFFENPLSAAGAVSVKAGTYASDAFPPGCTVANGCIVERP